MKRLCSIALLCGILLLTFISCAADTADSNTSSNTTTAASDDVVTDETVVEETKSITYLDANLPEEDYDGYVFSVLSSPHEDRTWKMFDVEEINGEPLNDAIYSRNEKIKSVFNIEIEVVESSSVGSDVPKVVNANDDVYDLVYAPVTNMLTFAQNGYLIDFYMIPYIDLEREWWDQSIINDLTVSNQLYVLTGDLSPVANIRTYSLVFNKDLCNELGLDYPYEYVLNGTWTMDMFAQYAKGVNQDLNGDGVMNYQDRWGYFSQYGNSYMMFIAGGGRIVETDSQGLPQITMDNEKRMLILY